MQTADDMLADILTESIRDLKINIQCGFKEKMGLSNQIQLPEALYQHSMQQLLETMETEFTQMLLEVLINRNVPTGETPTPGSDIDVTSQFVTKAFERVTTQTDEVLGTDYFQQNFPQVIMAFFVSNLPCSSKKYAVLNEMA